MPDPVQADPVRDAFIVAWTTGYGEQRVVKHRACGTRTLCGLTLSGVTVQAPHLDNDPVYECTQCRR